MLAGPLIVVAAMLGLGVAQVEAKRMPGLCGSGKTHERFKG